MKKPSLKDSLTSKPDVAAAVAPPQATRPQRLTDRRINTTLRLEPEKLERLKIVAARKQIRVNDLLLEGVDHVLALYSLGTAA